MGDNINTIFGWLLFCGIVVLGLSAVALRVYDSETPEQFGYAIEVADEASGGATEMSMEAALNMETSTVEAGEAVFAKCIACHTITPGGADGIGPNLHGIMGKPVAGASAGFAYSGALAEKGGTWDWQTMSDWLKSPRAFANGTKMSFAGLSSIEDRAAVAIYMNAQGSNLPIPEYVEAVADEAGEDAVDAPAEVGDAEAAGAVAAETPVPEAPGDQ